ncbi:NARE ribosyltransferase, partial [Alcedo cyanopectus]|nr:NARE ribosyltransferase [Ceyx cyanopectus]
MEHLALGWVLLVGTLVAGSPLHGPDGIPEKEMDMAPASFDDQYRGCDRMMEEELAELNRTEFANKSVYAEAWTLAAAEWRNRHGHVPEMRALRPELAIALLAYTREGTLYREFNEAVREAGRSRGHYLQRFHFKALHFLLSEALRALRDARPRRCYRVYRGVRGVRFTAQQHRPVRFGHFTSASLRKETAESFGQDTFFSVQTCYSVPIENFSFYPVEEEVLIPPFESFQVTNVSLSGNRSFIQLLSQAASSTYNCEFVKG